MQGRMIVDSAQLKNDQLLSVAHVDEDDAEALVAYLRLIAGESDFLTFAPVEFAMTVEEEVSYIRDLYARKTGFLLKATIDGEVVSTAGIQRVRRARIEHVGELGVAVQKRFWNLGVGRIMCQCVMDEGRAMGLKRIELKVRTDNTKAIHLYESLGFQTEGIRRRSFCVSGTFFDEALMARLFDQLYAPAGADAGSLRTPRVGTNSP